MIKTIKDIEVLFNEGRLTYVVINDKCEDIALYAYTYRGKKVEIKEISPVYLGFLLNNGSVGYLEFEYVDIEATEKLIKEKEMTKSDLKDGMVVKLRNGDKMLVLNYRLLDLNGCINTVLYNKDLKHCSDRDLDIMKVFETNAINIKNILESTIFIWERKEKSEAEIKLEAVMNQIKELQKSADELRIVIDKDKR